VNCRQFQDLKFDLTDGALPPALYWRAQAHLRRCEPCRRSLQQHARLEAAVARALEDQAFGSGDIAFLRESTLGRMRQANRRMRSRGWAWAAIAAAAAVAFFLVFPRETPSPAPASLMVAARMRGGSVRVFQSQLVPRYVFDRTCDHVVDYVTEEARTDEATY
jgi:predicted anti-sigma-YlaC factor YlaD